MKKQLAWPHSYCQPQVKRQPMEELLVLLLWKKGSRSNFGTFLVCPEQFSKRPEGDALNVHKSRMYTNQDIHMRVWDHMKCIPTGLPNLKECPPGHIIHPGIVSSGHSVSGHSVTRGIVSLRGNVSPGAYCPSRRMSPGHSVSGACRLGPSHLSTKKSFTVQKIGLKTMGYSSLKKAT